MHILHATTPSLFFGFPVSEDQFLQSQGLHPLLIVDVVVCELWALFAVAFGNTNLQVISPEALYFWTRLVIRLFFFPPFLYSQAEGSKLCSTGQPCITWKPASAVHSSLPVLPFLYTAHEVRTTKFDTSSKTW